MYIIDRLIDLLSKSDPDSSDYILASCFLDRSTFINEKVTLAEIEKKTFISKSSTNRFVRACGASTLKSFCASLLINRIKQLCPCVNQEYCSCGYEGEENILLRTRC